MKPRAMQPVNPARLTDTERLAVLVALLRSRGGEVVLRVEPEIPDAFTVSVRVSEDETLDATHETVGTGVTLYDAIDNAHVLHWRDTVIRRGAA